MRKKWKISAGVAAVAGAVVVAPMVVPMPQPAPSPIDYAAELEWLTRDGQSTDPNATNGWDALVGIGEDVDRIRREIERREFDADEAMKRAGGESEAEPWTYDIFGGRTCEERTERDRRLIEEFWERLADARILERVADLRKFEVFIAPVDDRLAEQLRAGFGGSVPTPPDKVAPLRRLSRALDADLVRAMEAGDWERALARVDDALFVGRVLRFQADTVRWLTGRAFTQVALRTVHDAVLSGRDVPEWFLREMMARMESLEPASIDRIAEAEALSTKESIEATAEFMHQSGMTIAQWLLNRGVTVERARAIVDEKHAELALIKTLDVRELENAERAMSNSSGRSGFHGLALGSMTSPAHMLKHVRQDEMHNDVTRIMVSLALFAAEHGAPPATLGELVPEYLPTLPEDPFGSGGTFRYIAGPTMAEVVVYSVGWDGKDDGGWHIPERAHRALSPDGNEGLDYVFTADWCAGRGE